jgi:hypothetical protein
MTTQIKITQLVDIGANLATTTLLPVVNMTGVPTTQKTNLGNVGNVILAGAGTTYQNAALANLAYSVTNAAQPNITSVGTLTSLSVTGNATINGNITSNGTAYVGNLSTTGLASITTLNVVTTANIVGGGATVATKSVLNVDSTFGSNSSTDPASAQAVRGRVTGSNLTKTRNYVTGVTGQYLITGTNASEFIKAGILGVVGDQTTTADGAVVAYLDGDGGLTTANAAYAVSMKNSTPNSGFNYGLDLQFISLNLGGVTTSKFKQADIRFNNGVTLVANTAGNISINGNLMISTEIIANGIIQSGTGFSTGGYLSVNGTTDLHDTTVTGNLSATGDVTANAFIGDGSQLTNIPSAGTSGEVQINWQGSFSNQGGTPDDTYSTLQFDSNGMPTLNGTNAYQQRVNNSPYMQIFAPRVESTDFDIAAGPGLTVVGYDDTYNTPRSAYMSVQDQANATQQWDFGILGNGNNNFVVSDRTNSNEWQFGTDGTFTLPGNTFAVNYANGTQVSIGGGGSNLVNGAYTASLGAGGEFTIPGNITLPNGAVIKDTAGNAVAFGEGAGTTSQGSAAVAIGKDAGTTTQGQWAVAIGTEAGNATQGAGSVAIGLLAGKISQGGTAVAVGPGAGYTNQGNSTVAIGYNAGSNTQGTSAVAIGYNAGRTSQGNNSIILNATGANLDQTTANTFTVKPVRGDSTANLTGAGFKGVYYNPTTGEFCYTTD